MALAVLSRRRSRFYYLRMGSGITQELSGKDGAGSRIGPAHPGGPTNRQPATPPLIEVVKVEFCA